MASVFLARDRKHADRRVALKILRAEVASALGPERFLREIRIAAVLSHPHIVPMFDSGDQDGMLYSVMPFVAGVTLRARPACRRRKRHGPWPRVLGTPGYMSPEQASGILEVDQRADLYSLGCVVYEMVVGARPRTLLDREAARAGTVAGVGAVALCRLGRSEEGLEWTRRALEIDPEDAGVRYSVACLYALEGRTDEDLDCLDACVRLGFGNVEWIDRDPDTALLRGLPRFEALVGAVAAATP